MSNEKSIVRYPAVCKFCGQVVQTSEDFADELEAVEYGSTHCKCERSVRYREIGNAKAKADRILCDFDESVRQFVSTIIDGIGDEWLCRVTAKIDYRHTITISMTAKGKIKLHLEKKTSTTTEL